MDLSKIRKFSDKKVNHGEKYIFSASFDVKPDLKHTERMDEETADLKKISDNGGVAVILSHQGRLEYGDVKHLDFVAEYLSSKLGRVVKYFPENNTAGALEYARNLGPGEIAILGNTRFHEGETKNHPELARQFAELGDFVIAGGFTKAHRNHASNYGILDYRPGFLAGSCIEQIRLLEPWQGRSPSYSVAVLGGVKKEKIKALQGLARYYDYVIAGGIVLNTALKVLGHSIGDSLIMDGGKSYEPEMEKALREHGEKIHVPSRLMAARKTTNGFEGARWIDVNEGVPNGLSIVDFELDKSCIAHLERAANEKGRILLAGTPAMYKANFTRAVGQIMRYASDPRTKSILLGGDTTNEIPFGGTKSTGGGSALEYLCSGELAIIEALEKNRERFPIA